MSAGPQLVQLCSAFQPSNCILSQLCRNSALIFIPYNSPLGVLSWNTIDWVAYKQQKYISHSSEGCKFKIRLLAQLAKVPLSDGGLLVSPCRGKRRSVTSSSLKHLPKILYTNRITFRSHDLYLKYKWFIIVCIYKHIFKFYYWSIIALQCCVSFCCMTMWISYMYTHIPFLSSFPSPWPRPTPLGHHRALSSAPCTVQQLPAS